MAREFRPSLSELGFYASLLNSSAGKLPRPHGLSDHEFVRQLDYHGITMLVEQAGNLPKGVLQHLGPRKALMVANEALKSQALIELCDAFASAGLQRNIIFKGGALAYSIYSKPWLRPRSDTDCLIDQSEHPQFAEVLFDLGYHKLFSIEGQYASCQHTYSKQLAGQSVMNIDLHWRINNRHALAKAYSVDNLIETSSTLSALSDSIKIPHPSDSLLIASLHRLGHHPNEERLTWLNDIHLLANALSEGDDWQQLCTKAREKRLAGITLDSLNFSQRLFATVVSKETWAELRAAAANKEPSQLFFNRELPEWRYFLSDIAALEGWGNKLWLIYENVFPSPDYVRQQMGTKSALLAYFKRAMRGLARMKK
ncbi:MAG: hypothetical protein ACI9SX_001676 [Pseudoalteromonas tetraodonis]|jgi:hypothetical protein